MNGTVIQHSGQLPPLVAQLQPGSDANVVVLRDRAELEIPVKVAEWVEQEQVATVSGEPGKGVFGLAVRPADPESLIQGEAGGLLVERVTGAAARAGVRPGDVVLAVNGQAVTAPEQLRDLAAKVEKHAALLIQRGKARMYVPIELG